MSDVSLTRQLGLTLEYGCTIDDIKTERGTRLFCELRTDIFWMKHCLTRWRHRI